VSNRGSLLEVSSTIGPTLRPAHELMTVKPGLITAFSWLSTNWGQGGLSCTAVVLASWGGMGAGFGGKASAIQS